MAQKPLGKLDWGKFAHALGPRIRLLSSHLAPQVFAKIAKYDLPTGALTIMVLISANSGCSQVALSRQAGMNRSAMVGVLDELERRGLAVRNVVPDDRRRNALSLTSEGHRLMEEMQQAANAAEVPIRQALSEEELVQLLALLDKINDAMMRIRTS